MRGHDTNHRPRAGRVLERINAYVYFAWLIILIVIVVRGRVSVEDRGDDNNRGSSRSPFNLALKSGRFPPVLDIRLISAFDPLRTLALRFAAPVNRFRFPQS